MQVWKETLKTIWIKHASSIRPLSGKNIYYPVCSYILYKYSNQFETVLTLQMKCIFMFLSCRWHATEGDSALCDCCNSGTCLRQTEKRNLVNTGQALHTDQGCSFLRSKKKKNIFQKCLLFPYWFKWHHRHSSMCVLCMNTVYWLV